MKSWNEIRKVATGLCTAKTYADGSFATNTWTADGLPLRAVNPDESWTEKVYDSNRRCVGQMSSDPSCAYGLALDVFGRTVAASNDVARYVYALAHSGIATNETATAGVKSFSVVRGVDPYGRITSVARDGMEDSISYNPTNGTVAAVSNAEACVAYAYTSDLLDGGHTLTLADGARFTRTLVRGSNYQRGNVSSVVNVSPLSTNTFAYTYDALNRPVSRNSDAFAYNTRGEVASATVDACSAAYAYDGIGNLLETSVATGGLTADATYYDANALNQYYSIWSPDDSSWIEHSTNGELTRLDDRGFLYDAKSRLVSVGEWVFDEERYLADDYDYYDELYSFEPIVSNRYDHLDRRVQKITPAATHTYFYDGWMLIKEIVANTNGTTDVIEYHWGKDLSGTIGGAGGVGGLLYLSISNSSTPQLYIPWYDAYGNIMGYWDAQGNVVAEYTYDAFGKLISSSGPMANAFSFRYSTKYFDPETGFYYYGYRFYSPELMRWITRDPIGEDGGVNLYAMCGNDLVVYADLLGEFKIKYQTSAETSISEYVRTGNKLKDIEARNENDVWVETKGLNIHGLFNDSIIFTSDCQLDVNLWIWLANDLQVSIRPFDEFIIKPHKTTTDGYSRKKGGGRPMKGAILAHERGHAKAFFEYQKPLFESKITSLISKPKLTAEEKEVVKRAYAAARKETIPHSARLASEAERTWYINNGFISSTEGELYVFKRNK